MNELLGKIVVIKRNGSDGPHFPLRTNECLFGRKPECDIRIQLPNVSQEHAVIRVDNDKKIRLINLSSCNETLVNGKPVDTAEVQHLDVFTISDRSFRFEFPSPVQKAIKSPKKQQRRSSLSPKSGQENKTPNMLTSKGSPRTPPAGGSLKERIHYIRRNSMPLQEEEEGAVSPVIHKAPLETMAINLQELGQNGNLKGEMPTKTRRHSKRVSFGPVLSPEQFDKSLPPATPVRRGATPKRPSLSSESTAPADTSSKHRSVGASTRPAPIVEEEDMETLVTEKAPQNNETPKSQRRLSLRIAAKSPRPLELGPESVNGSDLTTVQSNNVIEQSANSSTDEDDDESDGGGNDDDDNDDDYDVADDNEQDETAVLDSDNYTSDEESEPEQKASIDLKTSATPACEEMKKGVELQEAKKKLATPVRDEIKEGVKLRETKKKMATPVRTEIQEGIKLRQTKKKLATPVRNEIQEGFKLRETKKKMATPVRNEIQEGFKLRETKKKLATPVRNEIRKGVKLRETMKKLSTPLRKEIRQGVRLKETKRKLSTPLRREIKVGMKLKRTKVRLPTPLRKAIRKRPSLKATKKRMATPIREEIKARPSLRQTKKAMNSVLQSEIKQGVTLKKTKKTMALELQIEIIKGKKLNETVKKLPSPLKKAIAEGMTLRKSKKSLPTPVREEIREGTVLRKTKKSLPTPVRNQIEEGIELRQLKKKVATPLRKAIQDGVSLKATKRRLSETELNVKSPKKPRTTPTADLSKEDEKQFDEHVPVRKALKTPLRKAIASGVRLRVTRRRMNTPLRRMIHAKPTLKAVCRKSGITNVSKERATSAPTYADVLKRPKLTGIRRLSRGPSFEFGKAAQQFNKVECDQPSTILVSAATSNSGNTETPKSPVPLIQERRRSTRISRSIKKPSSVDSPELNQSLTGVSELFASPLAESNGVIRRKSNWLSSLSRAANGPKTRRKPTDDDLEGLSALFATPPAAETRSTRSSSKPKRQGSWLSSLAIATNGPHRRTKPVEDLQGVAEMFGTPPLSDRLSQPRRSTTRKRCRSVCAATAPFLSSSSEELGFQINSMTPTPMPGLVVDASSPERKVQKVDALGPNKTPSLRHANKDTLVVETGTPIQSSCKPVLRSTRKQAMSTVESPLPSTDLENVKALNLSKTVSLRNAETNMLNVEMVSPIQSCRTPSLRSAKKQAISKVESPLPTKDLENVKALNLSKTPSLRNAETDALNVEMVSPIRSSRTPSLRSAKKQAMSTVESPLPTKDLEKVEALNLSKTPSLRNAETAVLNVEVVSPFQSSRTPSLRSAKKQAISTVASPLPTTDLEKVEALHLSKTPSLRNADTDQVMVTSHTPSLRSAKKQSTFLNSVSPEPTFHVIPVREPSKAIPASTEVIGFPQENSGLLSSDRKSFGLTGLARLMKCPRESNAVENPADLFVPSIFKSPKSERKRITRNSVGLQGIARLMRTPKGEASVESPRLDGIKRMIQPEVDVESPDLVGIKKLMKTPKSPRIVISPENNFVAELFASPELKTNDAGAVRSGKQTVNKSMKAVIDLTLQDMPVERTTRRRRAAFSELLPKSTRAKRCAPEDSTAPTPKRVRRTRTAEEKREGDRPAISNGQRPPTKALKGKRAARGKNRKAVSVETPKRFLFHHTRLEPITEVPTPVPNFDVSEDSSSSSCPVVEKKESRAKGVSRASEPVQEERKPPKRSSRSRTGGSRETKSSREESSTKEAPTKQRSTRAKKTEEDAEHVSAAKKARTTRKGVVESEEISRKTGEQPQVTTRTTRSKIAELCSVQNNDVPKQVMTRITRSRRRTRETDVDEQPVAVVLDEESWNKPTSTRRGRNSDFQQAKIAHTTRSREKKNEAEESFPKAKSTRSTRGGERFCVERTTDTPSLQEKMAEKEIAAERVESKPKRSLRSEPKIVEVHDQPKISQRTRSNANKDVPVTNAAPARKERKTRAGKRQVVEADPVPIKASGIDQVEETRSCRAKRIPEQADSLKASPPKTRGTKRTRQEDAKFTAAEPKRTRSSSRTQADNVRQTRSRARK